MITAIRNIGFAALLLAGTVAQAADGVLKPFVMGNTPAGDTAKVVEATKAALTANGFEVVGGYSPYAGATVIVATHADLKAAAAKAKNGGFGLGQRVAVTEHKGKIQVSYMNPAYMGAAYGLGDLQAVSDKLKAALGANQTFGAEGLTAEELAPGNYHYMIGMPYFHQTDSHGDFASHEEAVATIEKNLAAGKMGTVKVYRIDLPAKQVVVFGVGIRTGDGEKEGAKDTDKEIMDIIDYKDQRATATLPYEIMVQGKEAISMRGRYRIALHFPDTKMAGDHGFTKIMSSPGGIKKVLSSLTEK
jgi:hypothetical protein